VNMSDPTEWPALAIAVVCMGTVAIVLLLILKYGAAG